jgi:hypothetical protein
LLQTADYAHTLIQADNPGDDDEEIERGVNLRMVRQSLLTRVTAAPNVPVVLNEPVLGRPVGGREVMVRQRERLVETGRTAERGDPRRGVRGRLASRTMSGLFLCCGASLPAIIEKGDFHAVRLIVAAAALPPHGTRQIGTIHLLTKSIESKSTDLNYVVM